MPEEVVLDLKIDEKSLIQQLESIEERRKELDGALDRTKKKSKETWKMAVGIAQASWTLIDTILETSGVAITHTLRASIQGAFAAQAILTPLLTAESVTPGMQALAAFGFFQLGLSIAAAIAADVKATEIETELNNTEKLMGNIANFAGEFNYL